MKKWIGCILLLMMLMTLGMTGCGSSENTPMSEEPEVIVPTGILVPVADYREVKFTLSDPNVPYVWRGDSFVFMERKWNADAQKNICTLSRVAADGMSEPEPFYQNTLEEPSIWCFNLDSEGNIYTLSGIGSGTSTTWSLRKYDQNMQELDHVVLEGADYPVGEINYVKDIEIDSKGYILLMDYYNARIYLFDKELNFLGLDTVSIWFQRERFIDSGEQGSYVWDYDYTVKELTLQKINYEKGCLEDAVSYNISDYLDQIGNCVAISGYENGILLSTDSALWKFAPATGEAVEWINWKDPNVNINGMNVREIIFHRNNTDVSAGDSASDDSGSAEQGEKIMTILCHDFSGENAEMSEISFVDEAYAPRRKTIVLGTLMARSVQSWVNHFNRSNKEYSVEIKSYDNMTELTEELLFHQEEIPDLVDISWLSAGMLDEKGLLEDLKPYFKKSELVGEEDILEEIWDMCLYDGKLTSMMIAFNFGSCVTTAENISEDGWTHAEFFGLEKQYPESQLLLYFTENNVWGLLGGSGVNDFIDWEKKKCHFDSDEFRALMKQVKVLDYGNSEIVLYQEEETVSKLLAQDYLVDWESYGSPYWYRRMQKKYKGKVKNVGYPTQDGTPYYLVNPSLQFSIYADSENKDGAWAFIEHLLSEESQNWYGDDVNGFPVRKEAFEAFLTKPHSPVNNYRDDDPFIETYEVFTKMLEYSHLNSRNLGEISTIIEEELQAYYENAKTAEETSEIIQNRVQLYLDENF